MFLVEIHNFSYLLIIIFYDFLKISVFASSLFILLARHLSPPSAIHIKIWVNYAAAGPFPFREVIAAWPPGRWNGLSIPGVDEVPICPVPKGPLLNSGPSPRFSS
jgi:hypothetical protein